MRIHASRGVLAWSLIAFLMVGFSPLQSSGDGPADVQLVGVKVQRLGRQKAFLRLKVVNRSDRPVFVAGINIESPEPYPVFLEQWRAEEGWTAVLPCMDVPPPQVIRLDPGKAIPLAYNLRIPPWRTCLGLNFQFEGRFRYRLDYFMSEKEAQAYLHTVYSPGRQPPRAHVALSEPFEIPRPKN
jgi:hypothetical protein